jgi:hypothetical protein
MKEPYITAAARGRRSRVAARSSEASMTYLVAIHSEPAEYPPALRLSTPLAASLSEPLS